MSYFSELHAEGPYCTCGEADEARRFYPEEYAMTMQPKHEYKSLLLIDELVDALEDVGFHVNVAYPYVIVSLANRSITPGEVAYALDIDPALCCYNLNGNIRITCE